MNLKELFELVYNSEAESYLPEGTSLSMPIPALDRDGKKVMKLFAYTVFLPRMLASAPFGIVTVIPSPTGDDEVFFEEKAWFKMGVEPVPVCLPDKEELLTRITDFQNFFEEIYAVAFTDEALTRAQKDMLVNYLDTLIAVDKPLLKYYKATSREFFQWLERATEK